MGSATINFADGLSSVAKVEDLLATSLKETADDLARSECFDDEQRSELYVILETLCSDTNAHREVLGQWISHQNKGAADV